MTDTSVSQRDQGLASRLAGCSLFAYFTADELGRVVSMVHTRRFGKGDFIFGEGDVGKELYIVDEGSVAISKAIKDNLEQVLAHMGPGDYFGEMAVIENIPRTASASAETDCSLLSIAEADIMRLMEDEPRAAAKIMFNLMKTMSARLQATNEQLREAVRWGLEATGYQPEE